MEAGKKGFACLEGKVAIVTGAAGTIGLAATKALLRQGAKVMLVDLKEDALKTAVTDAASSAKSPEHLAFCAADVSKGDSVKKYVEATEAKFGRVDILFNNAGIGKVVFLEDHDDKVFDEIFAVNTKGVYLGMKHVVPAMKKVGGGSIINTSSTCGFVGLAGLVAYTGSKFAVRGMTKTAAKELASNNIRVTSVHPGPVEGPLVGVLHAGLAAKNNVREEDVKNQLLSEIALHRYASPEDIANMVVYLSSDEASYLTGQEYVVDGGYLK